MKIYIELRGNEKTNLELVRHSKLVLRKKFKELNTHVRKMDKF